MPARVTGARSPLPARAPGAKGGWTAVPETRRRGSDRLPRRCWPDRRAAGAIVRPPDIARALPLVDVSLAQQLVDVANQGPTITDWLAAIGTMVAAVGTVGTLAWQARGLKQERETRRDEVARLDAAQRDAEDAQARTVVLHDPGCDGMQWKLIQSYKVTVGNYGTHPITNVVAALTHRASRTHKVGPTPLPVLTAGAHQTLTWRVGPVPWPSGWNAEDLPNAFDCRVEFTDVHGIRWALRPGLGQEPSRVYGA